MAEKKQAEAEVAVKPKKKGKPLIMLTALLPLGGGGGVYFTSFVLQ